MLVEVNLSFEEIKLISKYRFSNLIKEKIRKHSFEYLKGKQAKKGRNITYKYLEMAEYLQPNCELDIEDRRKMFELRNEMTNIPTNFGKKTMCLCGEIENLMHIYNCKKWNEKDNTRKSFAYIKERGVGLRGGAE